MTCLSHPPLLHSNDILQKYELRSSSLSSFFPPSCHFITLRPFILSTLFSITLNRYPPSTSHTHTEPQAIFYLFT
jgi:hypothetical protein